MSNTVAIDFLTKCRIDLPDPWGCIEIAIIFPIIVIIAIMFLVLGFIIPYVSNKNKEDIKKIKRARISSRRIMR